MKVLVTGGAGFIGSHVVDRLVGRGDEVVVLDDLSTGLTANMSTGARLIRHNVADPATRDLVRTIRPDAVIQAAAQPSVSASLLDPAADARTNLVGGLHVLMGAADAGARRLVYLGTGGALYGETSSRGADESELPRPLSPYGLSKWAFERYLPILLPAPGAWANLRLANVYGPRQRPDGEAGVVSVFCDRMLRREPVEIHGDGLQSRDFVFVGDVADAVVAAIDDQRTLTLNISGGTATTIMDLFRTLAALTGYDPPPVHVAPRSGDVRYSRLDPERARRELGWSPRVGLEPGLRATLDWHRGERGAAHQDVASAGDPTSAST